jgi:hypothetical protein
MVIRLCGKWTALQNFYEDGEDNDDDIDYNEEEDDSWMDGLID